VNGLTLYNSDCRAMKELPDNSVQCVVTSPPYWGLRKYAGEQDLIWGNVDHCQHEWVTETKSLEYVQGNPEFARPHREKKSFTSMTNTCSLCGAWRGAYGLEPTPELYVQHTIEILREIKRVLRPDGVVFWNIGDSYYSSPSNQQGKGNPDSGVGVRGCQKVGRVHLPRHDTLKPKDLCLIPFRVAIAAQEDGWWVRSDNIWNKTNPMPESVTDRPTNSHEYIFMFTKSARYYYDAEAVREPITPEQGEACRKAVISHQKLAQENKLRGDKEKHNDLGAWNVAEAYAPTGRNLRSVWTFPTQPYREAHFATFPEKLPELCIKAATPEAGCCSECGKPWERIIEHKNMEIDKSKGYAEASGNRTVTSGTMVSPAETKTLGWQPGCKCGKPAVPSIVLDPFAGSGTTLLVARQLGRAAVGYEISKEYCELIRQRNNQGIMDLVLEDIDSIGEK
jgi:DNA modification methylase